VNEFERLLSEHLLIAAKIVNAAKNLDTNTVNTERIKWYANADDIAGLLSSLNPYWSYEEWKNMLYQHLRLVEEEAVNRLNKRYSEDIALYDIIEEQALEMADMMSSGIIAQFRLQD